MRRFVILSILAILLAYNLCKSEKRISMERENMGTSINTPYDELMPVISADGNTLYFCRRNHPQNLGIQKRDDIWISHKNPDSTWTKAENAGYPLNNEFGNAVCSITPDGNTLLLGGDYFVNDSLVQGVFISHLSDKGWSVPQILKIQNFYFYGKFTSFYLSNDGRTLLMSLKRDDSIGGLDLYVSFSTFYDFWTKPLNMGSIINTEQDDITPYLAPDGKTLYFSSKGHKGYGDFDIFMSKRLDSTWTNWSEPVNLGPNINTKEGEASYFMSSDGKEAFFASTYNTYGGWDIFKVLLPEDFKPSPIMTVYGKVYNEKTLKPVESKIYYQSMGNAVEIGNARTNNVNGEYTLTLPLGYNYRFYVEADGYLTSAKYIDLTDSVDYDKVELNFDLTPSDSLISLVDKIDFLNLGDDSEIPAYLDKLPQDVIQKKIFDKITIHFDFNKTPLRDDAYPGLNYVIRLLKAYSDFSLAVIGHTDNVGGWKFNLDLSKKRAQAVTDYIYTQDIDKSRITVSGMGYDVPVDDNDTEEGRSNNRRVVFLILKR